MSVNQSPYSQFKPTTLTYRQGVGLMIINKYNQVFVGNRIGFKYSAWQMPQGGIDLGETPSRAALREMREEIGSSNATIIAETTNWYSYNIPPNLVPKFWCGKYCGQRQKWFLIRFHGEDSDINLDSHVPEFCEWQWVDIDKLSNIIVSFKRNLYKAVIKEFSGYL
jgi:putative (di)nucleoside polyphosphate hydrolase